jgi:TPP-dependent pyruvate/acetoin dehydrogenase alpha subunit/pyruvate/2-oxoglutarate/acetoin dehydrogenase E1 component
MSEAGWERAAGAGDNKFYTTPSDGWLSELGALADPGRYTDPIDVKGTPLDLLVAKLRDMLLIRTAEEFIADMVTAGEIKCPAHLAIGQEAASVGVAAHLRATDRAFGSHRSHSHYLAMGGSLDELMAETLGKATGCSRGFGGSMHLQAKSVGFFGSVPIVAGTIPLAVGAAMTAKMDGPRGNDGLDVGVAYFGDGACEEGVFHESLNLAASFRLPMIFVVENNLFSSHLDIHLRQPSDRIARFADAAKMRCATVDGNDVVAMMSAAGELIGGARQGSGPALIEAVTYRWRGHVGPDENIDVGVRRTKAEIDAWKRRDPIGRLLTSMEALGYSRTQFEALRESVREQCKRAVAAARDAPWPDASLLRETLYAVPRRIDNQPAGPKATQRMNYGQAIRAAHEYLLANYPEVFIFGQGVWSPWYVGNSMTDLDKQFGKDRVVDSPVSEAASTGAAVGASLCGYRPVVIHPRVDFMVLACDAIANQGAKWAHMLGGQQRAKVTIRGIVNRGGEQGAQHSQSLHSWFAHLPGLRVVMPASVADARDLFIAAVLSDDPTLYIDDRWLYDLEDDLPPPCEVGLDAVCPRIRRAGDDVTIVAAGYSVRLALDTAERLAAQGVSAEIIDLRVVNPIDHEVAAASTRKTGRLLVVDGGWTNCGLAGEIIAGVAERNSPATFKAAPVRLTLTDTPAPTSRALESLYYTSVTEITDRAHGMMMKA